MCQVETLARNQKRRAHHIDIGREFLRLRETHKKHDICLSLCLLFAHVPTLSYAQQHIQICICNIIGKPIIKVYRLLEIDLSKKDCAK